MSRKSKFTVPLRQKRKERAKVQRSLALIFALFSFGLLSACNTQNQTSRKIQQDTAATEIEGSLVFNNITLDNFDKQGRPVWQVKAKQAVYTKDKKLARIEEPTGDLFQDGEKILKVSAKSGEIQEDGEKIYLKGEITAKDIRNGAIFQGDELEWRPQEDLLIVRNNLKGNLVRNNIKDNLVPQDVKDNPPKQIQVSAKEGRYLSRKQQLELLSQVTAISKEPNLHMKTEHLVWHVKEQKLTGDKRLKMERYKNKQVTERVEADKSEVNLKTKIATLKKNVQLTSVKPPLLMSSNSTIWDLNKETVISDQPIQILHQQEQVTLTANQGEVDLEREVANLTGGTQGIGSRNQSQLYANRLRWDIPTQNVQASGNVIYRQTDPVFNTKGETAVGRLEDKSIVVKSRAGERVVTEIIP
ncbi:MAG: LPS export ABC transporter periplasmic protein LptC [Symploca sp. SIO1B1]|nr:LPS export ABC transporter periplasmic protein LptC [Symploca sp. SIO2D2]NER21721.1 LPS export ABC transporter periplasmic protein LptC [Symploca sp. SIO1C2]NER52871.1 LPS export ABC transporter periplasmic protein LptC [Symploca sp. SIO1A3]NER92572.1 LPS export ABC transporter periplasmic protein LptC [Symploca sp. SIO1B1]